MNLTVKKDFSGQTTFTVSTVFEERSLTTSQYVSDFQLEHLQRSVNYFSSPDEAIAMIKRELGI